MMCLIFPRPILAVFTLNYSSFELDKFIEDLSALFRLQATEKGLDFGMSLKGEVPKTIHSDPVRLAQVITNLVNNAIKFTSSGSVDVKLENYG